jgi:protein-S-isoprenylcysteine O-methyltransferase Ste14
MNTEMVVFQLITGALVALFVYFGMDVRHKAGARNFVAPGWLLLMKLCSFLLIGTFVWVVISVHQLSPIDWLALTLMTSGAAFVVAAKRALGKVHTFTGQYLKNPGLATHGVYAVTRNPLYLGVFQCEAGAVLFLLHQAPAVSPQAYPYWLFVLAGALVYAVTFNLKMAVREATYLEGYFGERYRRYRAKVPFLIPFTKAQ